MKAVEEDRHGGVVPCQDGSADAGRGCVTPELPPRLVDDRAPTQKMLAPSLPAPAEGAGAEGADPVFMTSRGLAVTMRTGQAGLAPRHPVLCVAWCCPRVGRRSLAGATSAGEGTADGRASPAHVGVDAVCKEFEDVLGGSE